MNNDRNMLEKETSEKLKDLIDKDENLNNKDDLLEKLFKYCRTATTLKLYNSKENMEIY